VKKHERGGFWGRCKLVARHLAVLTALFTALATLLKAVLELWNLRP
jgi:hypothetical protein